MISLFFKYPGGECTIGAEEAEPPCRRRRFRNVGQGSCDAHSIELRPALVRETGKIAVMIEKQAKIAWALMQRSREDGRQPFSMKEALIRAAWLQEIEASPKDESFELCQARMRRYSAKLRRS